MRREWKKKTRWCWLTGLCFCGRCTTYDICGCVFFYVVGKGGKEMCNQHQERKLRSRSSFCSHQSLLHDVCVRLFPSFWTIEETVGKLLNSFAKRKWRKRDEKSNWKKMLLNRIVRAIKQRRHWTGIVFLFLKWRHNRLCRQSEQRTMALLIRQVLPKCSAHFSWLLSKWRSTISSLVYSGLILSLPSGRHRFRRFLHHTSTAKSRDRKSMQSRRPTDQPTNTTSQP